MQTSLPELPFTNYGRAQLDPCGFHSLGETTPHSHLRTDLETLVPWTSFPNDIHLAIQCATTRSQLPLSPFSISGGIWSIIVETEENIRAHATYTLHISVEEVVKKFGMKGRFALTGGSAPVVGDPDFLWVVGRTQKVIVCGSVTRMCTR
jgi:hypothetical protein